jgi:hypothetical protein
MTIGYNPRIVTDGLVLCLDAANAKSYPGSGTQWKDLSGLGNHATLVNGPTYSATNKGIFSFNGTNNSAYVSVSPDVLDNNPWTISIVCNISSAESGVGRQGWLVWKGVNIQSSNKLFSMSVTGGKLEIAHWSNDTIFQNADIKFDQWGIYSCTFDGSLENVYIDNALKGSKTTSLAIIPGDFNIGSRAGSSEFLNSGISNFVIYNRALTQAEITQNFNALRGRYGI